MLHLILIAYNCIPCELARPVKPNTPKVESIVVEECEEVFEESQENACYACGSNCGSSYVCGSCCTSKCSSDALLRIGLDISQKWTHCCPTSISTFSLWWTKVKTCGVAPFLDTRAYFFCTDRWGFDAGVGFRAYFAHTFGLNAFYDFVSYGSNFHTLGLGLEWLSPYTTLRVNHFIPLSSTQTLGDLSTYTYPGGYTATKQCHQDINLYTSLLFGTRLRQFAPYSCWDFEIALGPVYSGKEHCPHNRLGYNALLALRYRDCARIEAYGRYNHSGNLELQTSIGIFWYWGGQKNTECDAPNIWAPEPVFRERFPSITECCDWTQNW